MTTYSIPHESRKLLETGILTSPLHHDLPRDLPTLAAENITITGHDTPQIPIPYRLAESITSLKAFQATMLLSLLRRRYNPATLPKITINADHAQHFIMSSALTQCDTPEPQTHFPPQDPHSAFSDWHRRAATNIYRTRDARYYHVHGSMGPGPTQTALGVPEWINPAPATLAESTAVYQTAVGRMNAAELDRIMNDTYLQAGTVALSETEFRGSEQGRTNSGVGLYQLRRVESGQRAGWWGETGAGMRRPLAGLRVVELARVIAAPVVTRELAEMGAAVMRVSAPRHVPDMAMLFQDTNWGKWNCELDLREPGGREKLRALIMEADVVLDGYRPGVMAKYGFGMDDILKMTETRERGVVYVRENCYGWNGPLAHRSGWQQISDAFCGVSMGFGRAMGLDEPVTPVFPNSDYCTGCAGATGILQALIERAEKGGSFILDIALNYYSAWLINSCGQYPAEVWEQVWAANGKPVVRHDENMFVLIPKYLQMLKQNSAGVLFKPEYFEDRESKALGIKIRTVKPVLRFEGGEVEMGYTVGTRGNGVDKPEWPEDLETEVVV